MTRQHASPILLTADGAVPLQPLTLGPGQGAVSEATIQRLIHEHPSCLPIREIDPLFCNPVAICTELSTTAGPIDNFMVTPSGLPVLAECKLWRNPEGRREVVGQILDYAKELTRWTSSDLQREASRRLGVPGNALLDSVRAAGHDVNEIEFNDSLTLNLRRGRFLLLIVGDGIREGVEAIAEYMQVHAGLHFSLGLVEMPIYQLSSGEKLVVPRVLARTHVIRREVVAVPPQHQLSEGIQEGESNDPQTADSDPKREARRAFLHAVVEGLRFVDPDQPAPKITPAGYLYIYMPAPKSSLWLTVSVRPNDIGVYLSANRNSIGDSVLQRLATHDWSDLTNFLGPNAEVRPWYNDKDRFWIAEFRSCRPLDDERYKEEAVSWLRERIDTWVAVLRPRIRSMVADIEGVD